jgi:iron-sulfur cluster repair protein YtfE (RIC family)
MPDVTRLLEQDHRKVEKLFSKIKEATGASRADLVTELAADLRIHMQAEEMIVYPYINKHLDDGSDMVEEAVTEHEGARKVLADVERLSPNEPGFDGALEMLEAGISHHVEEEETEVFPELRESAPEADLDDLGQQVLQAKGRAGFDALTRDELYEEAQKADIPGRASMSKDELAEALSQRG